MSDATGDRDSGIASVVYDSAALRGVHIAQPAEGVSSALTGGVAMVAATTGGAAPPARVAVPDAQPPGS